MQTELVPSWLSLLWQGFVNWWKGEKENPHSIVVRTIRIVLRVLLVLYFIFCFLILSLRYVVLPQVPQYKTTIESTLSKQLSNRVTIDALETSWHGINPLLKLKGVTIYDNEGNKALQLPSVRSAISWRSLFVFDLRLSLLEINQPEVDIRRNKDGKFFVAGMLVEKKKDEENDWLFRQDFITINDAKIRWTDERRDAPSIELNNIHFVLGNNGRHHRVRFLAKTDLLEDGELDLSADFIHPRFASNVADFSKWEGSAYLSIPKTDINVWTPYIDLPKQIKKGTGSVNLWAIFNEGHIEELTGDIDLKNVQLQIENDLPILNVVQMSGRVETKDLLSAKDGENLKISDRIHRVDLKDVNLVTADGIKVESFDFSENYIPEKDGASARLEITTDDLDLEVLAKLANYLPFDKSTRQLFEDLAPKGKLNKVSLNLEGSVSDITSYQVSGDFNQLSIRSVPEKKVIAQDSEKAFTLPALPGIQNLTGHLSMNKTEGTIELKSPKSSFKLPSYFPKTDWYFDQLNMKANWQNKSEQVSVNIQNASFLFDEIQGSISGSYKKAPEDQVGFVDLTANIASAPVDKVRHFVPVDTPKALRDWLTLAFESGKATNVKARLKGDLTEFPFNKKENQGEFSVVAKLNDVQLNYAPTPKQEKYYWMPIHKINGQVNFQGAKISIHADTAELNGVHLEGVDVIIPDMLSDDVGLDINGKAKGELQQFVQFVNASPIDQIIGGLTQESITAGNASLLLKMKLPLMDLEKSLVEGTLQLDNNDVLLFEDLPVIKQAKGKVHFSEGGFNLEGLEGQFLGGKASIAGGTSGNGFQVKATGDITAEGLRANYTTGGLSRVMKLLSGGLSYTVTIFQKDSSKESYPKILVESDTKGLGIHLPAPLGKKSSDVRKLQVEVNPLHPIGKDSHDEIKINYGIANAYYERQQKGKNWNILKGGMGINTKPTLYSNVSAHIKLPKLDINEWKTTLRTLLEEPKGNVGKSGNNQASGAALYVEPQQFFIQTDQLIAENFNLSHATITGGQHGGNWQADINSDELKGQVTWISPNDQFPVGKIKGRIDALTIKRGETNKMEDVIGQENVQEIPEIDLVIDRLNLFGINLGRVELDTEVVRNNNNQEWHVKYLNIINDDSILKSNGIWVINKATQRTQMAYELDIKDSGELLSRFGYKGILKSAPGVLKGNIGWAGLPHSIDLPSLSGKIEVDVGRGQFLKVDPGIAKLLAVLNLQSIPRRLTLDFRDMFSDGFAFDEIKAKIEIVKGVARTENLTMKGVQATVLMDGNVDIAKETQDLHVAVLPEINAGMASLAYSVINPAIGVGTLLAQLLLKEPLAQAFTFEYKVTGSWADPTVTKVEKKKESQTQQSDIHN